MSSVMSVSGDQSNSERHGGSSQPSSAHMQALHFTRKGVVVKAYSVAMMAPTIIFLSDWNVSLRRLERMLLDF